jgi:hypothetical protein
VVVVVVEVVGEGMVEVVGVVKVDMGVVVVVVVG